MKSEDKKRHSAVFRRPGKPRRRSRDWLEIRGYRIGDVKSDRPLFLASGSAIAGDISAPVVLVAGLIYGFVTTRDLVIEEQGQVWGDVYTATLQLAPGGKIHGWVSTLDEGTLELLRAQELSISDLPAYGQPHVQPELLQGAGRSDSKKAPTEDYMSKRVAIWRQLQSEAAVALLARSEIETAFEERVAQLLEGRKHGVTFAGGVEDESDTRGNDPESSADTDESPDGSAVMTGQKAEDPQLLGTVPNGGNRDLVKESMELVRRQQVQLKTLEAGISHIQRELESRAGHMAELQSTLVEKDLQLQQAKNVGRRQAKDLQQVKETTVARIRQLESELARTQRKLADLYARLERHRRNDQSKLPPDRS